MRATHVEAPSRDWIDEPEPEHAEAGSEPPIEEPELEAAAASEAAPGADRRRRTSRSRESRTPIRPT